MNKNVLIVIITIILTSHTFAQNIDSLIFSLNSKEGKEKVLLLSDISYYTTFTNTKKAIQYANQCLEEAIITGDSLLIAEGYNILAIAFYSNSNYEKALELNKRALQIRLKHGDDYSLLSSYSKIGNCLQDIGKYDEALQYYLKSLKICEKNSYKQQIGLITNNIAEIFRFLKQNNKALEYYNKSIKIAKELNDTLGLSKALMNLGIFYMQEKKYENADSIYNKTQELIKNKNLRDVEAGLYINYGVLYKEMNYPEKSIDYYKKAKKIYIQTGEKHGLAIVYSNLGNSYLENQILDSALIYYKKGIKLANATNSLSRLQYAHSSMSNYYRVAGNYKKAYYHDSLADALQDSIYNIEKSRIIEEMNTKYETEKKEKMLAEQKTALANQKLKVQQKNIQFLSALGLLLILITLSGFIYKYQKVKQQKLQQQIALEKANALNKMQEEKLRISRDLHDNIGSQLTFITSSLDNLNYIKSNDEQELRVNNLVSFTKNTMNQLRETIWALNTETISLEQLNARIAEFLNQAKMAIPNMHFILESENNNIEFDANQAIQIYRSVQEAINNAIKHAHAEEVIIITNRYAITIEDNGCGFDPQHIVNGNGLANMKQRVEEAGFHFSISSTYTKGTKITIALNNQEYAT